MGKTAIISLAGSKKRQGIFPQARPAGGDVGHEPAELRPEGPAVAPDPGVDELVEDDVIGEVGRQDGQVDVELDASRPRGAAPDRALASDAQSPGREAVGAGELVEAPGQECLGLPAVDPADRVHCLAAARPGFADAGLGPADPGELAEGDPLSFLERDPPGDGHPDAP